MMTFWIIAGLLTVAVLVMLAWPLFASGEELHDRAEYDLKVYRDQLKDLDTDIARGLLSGEEAESARHEIERRLLRVMREQEDIKSGGSRRYSTAMAVLLILAVPAAALGLYFLWGQPGMIGHKETMADRARQPSAEELAQQQSVRDMVNRLAARLKDNPDDYQGWIMLGRSYRVLRDAANAEKAFDTARKLPEAADDPLPHMQYGEAVVMVAEGVVPPKAVEAFKKALAIDPKNPGARYYLALWRRQAGYPRRAYDEWVALAKDSPADAPWLPVLRARIAEVGKELGMDEEKALAGLPVPAEQQAAAAPGPSAEDMRAAQNMSPEERQKMIRSMVQRLADRLKDNPDDYQGWMRLGRAYQVLGEADKSKEAFARAEALKGRGGGEEQAAAAPGPSAEDMRAAQDMSPEERQKLIRSMVQRLADRMKTNPKDHQGWMRLGQAYDVLGEREKALDAFGRAAALRPDDVASQMAYAQAMVEVSNPNGPLPQDAVKIFRRVLELQPDNMNALWFVGMADVAAGDKDAAREKWERILKRLDPQSREYAIVKQRIAELGS